MRYGSSDVSLEKIADLIASVAGEKAIWGKVNEEGHRAIKYFPLVKPMDVGPTIGIGVNGGWVSGTSTNLRYVYPDSSSVGWLILLERSAASRREAIIESIGDEAVGVFVAEIIPIEIAIISGLESEMEYWNGLAMDRIDEGSVRVVGQVERGLNGLILDRLKSQRIRHRARKILTACS